MISLYNNACEKRMSKKSADNIRKHRFSGWKAGFIKILIQMKLIEEEIGQDIFNQIGHMHIFWFALQVINITWLEVLKTFKPITIILVHR